MKTMFKWNIILSILLCSYLSSCSSNDDQGGNFDMAQLIGSQWERNYSWIGDDAAWEEGKGTLTFTSSREAQEIVNYHGEDWRYNYDEDVNELKPYSGTSTIFYSYTVEGNQITLTDQDGGYSITTTLSGNMLVGSDDYLWTLIKAGEGGESGSGETTSYSWEQMQGVWMGSKYVDCASIIKLYKQQQQPSSAYYNGDFGVYGLQFNSNGQSREVDAQMKAFHNTGAIVLETIYASDGKTVYWTDISKSSYRKQYSIHGDKIYYNGKEYFQIFDATHIHDLIGGEDYVKVQ